MSEPFENETCGTYSLFARDNRTDEMGACFDFTVRICSGKYGYGAVPASGKACDSWQYNMITEFIPKVESEATE